MGRKLLYIYIGLGVVATVSALTAATYTAELGTAGVKAFSFASAVALGLMTAFNVGGKANDARNAWRLLNAAVLAYAEDPQYTIQELHKQYVAGEKLMGDISYMARGERPQPPEPTPANTAERA